MSLVWRKDAYGDLELVKQTGPSSYATLGWVFISRGRRSGYLAAPIGAKDTREFDTLEKAKDHVVRARMTRALGDE